MALSTIGTNQISNEVFQANRNLIINGAMQVAQRGTSSTGSSYQTVDRFFFAQSALDNYALTQTQQTVTDLAGFSNSFRITTTTAESAIAADELAYVAQKIEAQNLQQLAYGTSSAKRVTLSFYVKSSITGTFSTNLYQVDDNRIVNSEYTISSANTWERKEITYAADQTGVIDNDSGTGFYVTWNLALGSNYKGNAATAWEAYNTDNWAGAGTYTDAVITTVNSTWEITGVQLEIGDVATPFEHEDFATTLAKCQRYYYKMTVDTGADIFSVGACDSDTIADSSITFPVTMRDSATAIETSGTAGDYQIRQAGNNRDCTAVPLFIRGSPHTAYFRFTSHSMVAGQGVICRSINTSAYLAWSAEL